MPLAGDEAHRVTVLVSPQTRRVIRLSFGVAISLLVALGTAGEIARLGFGHDVLFGLVRLFGLGQEANVPTWYSSATLLIAATLAGVAARWQFHLGSSLARQWLFLAILLALMSMDETAAIHETVPALLARRILGSTGRPWYVLYAWLVPGTGLVLVILWWFSNLWRSLPPLLRRRFTFAVAMYFGGAVGLEFAEAAWLARAGEDAIYSVLWTAQEVLEMVGVAALILVLLDYLSLGRACITVRFVASEQTER